MVLFLVLLLDTDVFKICSYLTYKGSRVNRTRIYLLHGYEDQKKINIKTRMKQRSDINIITLAGDHHRNFSVKQSKAWFEYHVSIVSCLEMK